MLIPAEDEDHHAEEEPQVLTQLVGVLAEALHGDVDKDVAESVSKPYNDYFKQLDEINKLLQESLTNLTNKYSL